MKVCGGKKKCRNEYACRHADEVLDEEGQGIAKVLDANKADQRFCIAGVP